MNGYRMAFVALVMVPLMALAAEKATEKAKARSVVRKVASEELKCSEDAGKGMDADYIIRQAESAPTCFQAARVVEACGFGSSQDSATTAAAIEVCEKKTGKLSSGDASLKKSMLARCEKVCDPNREGTECLARQAFCRLEVAKFIAGVNNVD